MNAKEAIEALKLEGGIEITGNPVRIGTFFEALVEAEKALEKQEPKKCIEDSCPDHTHYKCPSCGKIQKTKYDDSTFGCILNNCSNCGQALMNENLEGMEDDTSVENRE